MRHSKLKRIIIILIPAASVAFLISILVLLLLFFFLCTKRRANSAKELASDLESVGGSSDYDRQHHLQIPQREELICFQGAEGLRIPDILEAPGEVIGKSSYGTLYKAGLVRRAIPNVNGKENEGEGVEEDGGGGGGDSGVVFVLLRFLRPACTAGTKEDLVSVVRGIGFARHPNLVPLQAFYVGPRGEKLLVHPFYAHGNLAQFIRDRKCDAWNWNTIYEISLGTVKGLCHLHEGLSKRIIHGNLKSKNVLLGRNCHPYLSDYGLHLMLNSIAGQEMLESSAGQGYKAPELIKMADVNETTDVFSLGVIFLELLTGKEPVNGNPSCPEEFYLPNTVRTAILDHKIEDLYQPALLMYKSDHDRMITKGRILKFVQLAITCCSPCPSLRPQAKDILQKLEEIGASVS